MSSSSSCSTVSSSSSSCVFAVWQRLKKQDWILMWIRTVSLSLQCDRQMYCSWGPDAPIRDVCSVTVRGEYVYRYSPRSHMRQLTTRSVDYLEQSGHCLCWCWGIKCMFLALSAAKDGQNKSNVGSYTHSHYVVMTRLSYQELERILSKKASKKVTAVPDCVSPSACVKPLDIFKGDPRTFPATFLGKHSRYLKPTHDLFLTLAVLCT